MFINQTYTLIQSLVKLKGVTLIELIVFIVVIGVTAVSLAGIYRYAMVEIHSPVINHQLMQMAQSQLETIVARRYDENTPDDGTACDRVIPCAGIGLETGESLANLNTLDDIDDFHNYIDQPQMGYQRQVSVRYAGNQLGIDQQQAKNITVTVTAVTGESLVLSIYSVNH